MRKQKQKRQEIKRLFFWGGGTCWDSFFIVVGVHRYLDALVSPVWDAGDCFTYFNQRASIVLPVNKVSCSKTSDRCCGYACR